MYRLVLLSVIVLAALRAEAHAIEMFTDFHNGENIGFPSMEVPTAIYGRGGWNARAMGRVPVPSGMPAMTPTGRGQNIRGRAKWSGQVFFSPYAPQTSNDPQRGRESSRRVQAAMLDRRSLEVPIGDDAPSRMDAP